MSRPPRTAQRADPAEFINPCLAGGRRTRYILGQLFNEWNVALGNTCLGGLAVTPGTTLRTFVDGVEVPGNPAALPLREHQQIALGYGPANAPVAPPATYDFSGA